MTAGVGVTFDMNEVQELLGNVEIAVPRALQETFNQAAELTRGEMVKAIQKGPATGRIYEKYNPRRTHQASAPGEAPMTDEGTLAASISTDTKSPSVVRKIRQARAEAGSPLAYAEFLEDGTPRMKPRPFAFPAFMKVQRNLIKLLRHNTQKRLK